MNLSLDRNFAGWPAQWRFCLALGYRPGFGGTPSEAFSFKKAVGGFLAEQPVYRWNKLFQALEEYYACLFHIRYLMQSAEKVAHEDNEAFIRQILEQSRVSLAKSAKEDWPELTGLWNQKLLHLRYYEDLFGQE